MSPVLQQSRDDSLHGRYKCCSEAFKYMHSRRQPDLQAVVDNAVMMRPDALVSAAVNIEANLDLLKGLWH